ncbi:CPBP family intramembrane glutamic endopeptidase [Paenibacillus apiarius]|uniref:CPBP family intramembrane glutamic endopeptidase n=1 Tax=Paenibacillus apiarius TaxID=46240 RepID=UPI001F094D9A|nr:type II CAAX endopeptidase family protein [Paenibacillus apiarius]
MTTVSVTESMITKKSKEWSDKDPWSVKELIALLLLTFVLVPWLIESRLQALFEHIFHNSLYSGTLTGLVMGITFTNGVYIIALLPKKMGWAEVGIRSFPRKYLISIAIWSFVLLAASVLILYLMSLLGGSYENSKTESIQSQISLFTVLIAVVSAGIVSPVYEEIFYRGFLYRWLRTRCGRGWASFLSSAIFMAAHIPTYNTLAINFVAGLIFAWTYENTKSVIPGMIVHGLTNTIFVLLTAAG